jgi:hypothetical protein
MTSNILDRSFRYVPSNETDIRKTFARIRKEYVTAWTEAHIEDAVRNDAAKQADEEATRKVRQIGAKKAKGK